MHADIVVCATEGAKVKSLINNMTEEESAFTRRIRYNSLGIVYHVLKNNPPHRITFYTAEHPSPHSIVETVPERHTKAFLFCELTPESIDKVAKEQAQEKMAEMTMEQTRQLYPALDEEIDYSVNQWIEHMLPVFYPGYINLMKNFVSQQEAQRQNIYYCGDYLSQALVGGACSSGKRTAETIIRHYNTNKEE